MIRQLFLHSGPRGAFPILALLLFETSFRLAHSIAMLRYEPFSALLLEAAGYFSGVLAAAILLPHFVPELSGNVSRPPTKRLCSGFALVGIITAYAVAIRLPGFQAWRHEVLLRTAALFGQGLLLPLCYGLFFRPGPPNRKGLWFGIRASLGTVVLSLSNIASETISPGAAEARMIWLFNLRTALLFILGVLCLLTLHWIRREGETTDDLPAPDAPIDDGGLGPARFIALAGLFFLMNGFLQMRFFPLWKETARHSFIEMPIILAVASPLIGLFIDRGPKASCKIILKLCAGLFVAGSALEVLSGSPLTYRILTDLMGLGNFASTLAITCALAAIAKPGRLWLLIICTPHFLQMTSMIGRWLFRETMGMGTGITVLVTILISMAMYHTVNTARIFDSRDEDAPSRLSGHAASSLDTIKSYMDIFHEHGLSPRECEVAMLLLEGLSSKKIAEQLHISESTVTTHVKKLLPKFGVTTRKAFMAIMLEKP